VIGLSTGRHHAHKPSPTEEEYTSAELCVHAAMPCHAMMLPAQMALQGLLPLLSGGGPGGAPVCQALAVTDSTDYIGNNFAVPRAVRLHMYIFGPGQGAPNNPAFTTVMQNLQAALPGVQPIDVNASPTTAAPVALAQVPAAVSTTSCSVSSQLALRSGSNLLSRAARPIE